MISFISDLFYLKNKSKEMHKKYKLIPAGNNYFFKLY